MFFMTFIISHLAYWAYGNPALQTGDVIYYNSIKMQFDKRYIMKKRFLIFIFIGLLLSACGYLVPRNYSPMSRQYIYPQIGNFLSNGEQIYVTATDQNGQRISYTGGPGFSGMMMGSLYTCASCHGNDGQGGPHTMHMQVMDAPAVYYDALIEMKKEDSGGNPTDYSLEDLRSAVVEGHDTAGDELDSDMPRWQMNDEDLADLLAFLKTLP